MADSEFTLKNFNRKSGDLLNSTAMKLAILDGCEVGVDGTTRFGLSRIFSASPRIRLATALLISLEVRAMFIVLS